MPELLTLRRILTEAETLPADYALYLPNGSDWTLESPCAVLDPDDCEDGEEEPAFARQHKLRYALLIADIQDIIRNARAQYPQVDDNGLLQALRHYFKHDAFIEF